MSSRTSDSVPAACWWPWWLVLALLAAVLVGLIIHLAQSSQLTVVEPKEQDLVNWSPGVWDEPNLIIYGRVASIDNIRVTSSERWLWFFDTLRRILAFAKGLEEKCR